MENIIDNPAEAVEVTTEAQRTDDTSAAQTADNANAAQAAEPELDALELVNRYRGSIIEFEPRKWKPNPDVQKSTKANRTFFTAENGEFRELWQLGDWNWNWSEIITGSLTLENYTDYRVIFWLRCDNNHDGNNICRFEITFDNDYESRNIYNLREGFVEPLMTKNGWKLYCIPFNTGGFESLTLRFVAQHAPISVTPAKYDDLSGVFPDKPPEKPVETAPKLDFSGLAGMEVDSEDILDRIFDFMNNPALPAHEKMQMMGMIQGIIG
jgi:hypothetical protein